MVLRAFSVKNNTFLLKKWQNNRWSRTLTQIFAFHKFLKNFAGINFRESPILKDFAGINFRESPILKDFAGINFRESTFSGVKKGIYFREFSQNSRNFLPAKISSLKVLHSISMMYLISHKQLLDLFWKLFQIIFGPFFCPLLKRFAISEDISAIFQLISWNLLVVG